MKNKKKSLFFLVVAFFVCFPLKSDAQVSEQKNILILHSYHQAYEWTHDIQQGLEDSLYVQFPNARIFVEYMDTKRIYSPEYLETLLSAYKLKYKNKKIDVIVSSDDNAFNLLLNNREDLFADVPIVFCGVNYFDEERLKGYSNITGVNEEASFMQSLEIALKLHPETTQILIINDTTTTGKIINREIESNLPALTDKYSVKVLGDSSIEDLLKEVKSYDQENTLIYFTLYLMDSAGKSFETGDVVSMLKTNTDIPIYGTWSFSLGHGIVGGYLTSGYHQGQQAGIIAAKILDGEKADNIPVLMDTPKEYMFDWKELERYGINIEDLPKESRIINKPASFLEENRTMIYALVITTAFLSLVIMVLALFILKRKQRVKLLNEYNINLEKKVEQRTKSLEDANQKLKTEARQRKKIEEEIVKKNQRLEKFNSIAIGRELKMVELKKKIRELENGLK